MLLYNIFSIILLPLYIVLLVVRIINGKEDRRRVLERFGISSIKSDSRKVTAPLIWIHAASVGESNIALTLISGIRDRNKNIRFLITSGTKTSAEILRQKLPPSAVHQFLPIDNIFFVRKFLNYWKPSFGIFLESELWPCIINEAAARFTLVLCNARLSDKAFRRWQKMDFLFKAIINNFNLVITQSASDFQKYSELGTKNLTNIGNLKFANKKLEVDELEHLALSKHFQNKKVITIASSHPEDEEALLKTIKTIKAQYQDCYFVLIPRHPVRTKEIENKCKELSLRYSLRSEKNRPDLDHDLYIIDKFGEVGLFYSLSYISFVGGSFKQGGHSPIEPAHFSNVIIFGPDMSKCQDIANEMLMEKVAVQINDSEGFLDKILYFLSTEGQIEARSYQNNAIIFVQRNQKILDEYLNLMDVDFRA